MYLEINTIDITFNGECDVNNNLGAVILSMKHLIVMFFVKINFYYIQYQINADITYYFIMDIYFYQHNNYIFNQLN